MRRGEERRREEKRREEKRREEKRERKSREEKRKSPSFFPLNMQYTIDIGQQHEQ